MEKADLEELSRM
jgi:hypothetical protein